MTSADPPPKGDLVEVPLTNSRLTPRPDLVPPLVLGVSRRAVNSYRLVSQFLSSGATFVLSRTNRPLKLRLRHRRRRACSPRPP